MKAPQTVVERLRWNGNALQLEAADDIERLTKQLVKQTEALKFYADPDNWIMAEWGDDDTSTEKAIPVVREDGATLCDCGDRARAALTDELREGVK